MGEGSSTNTTVTWIGPYHSSGCCSPQSFLKILAKNSKPALQSSTSAKASLKTTGNLLPLGTELGSNVIIVWRTGEKQRLI